jgi:hypothetical protein
MSHQCLAKVQTFKSPINSWAVSRPVKNTNL